MIPVDAEEDFHPLKAHANFHDLIKATAVNQARVGEDARRTIGITETLAGKVN